MNEAPGRGVILPDRLPPVRDVFLATGDAAMMAMSADETTGAWDRSSALAEMTVGELVAHLARAITQVEVYLDESPPAAGSELVSAGSYFAHFVDQAGRGDIASPANVAVRRRAQESAVRGQTAIVEHAGECLARLRTRFPTEPPDRTLAVFGGLVMNLDQYLLTRIVEMVVHMDDLCVSVGIPLVGVDVMAFMFATATLVQTASARVGMLGVVRALARRERDADDALRVF